MNNNKIIIIALVALVVVFGGMFAYTSWYNNQNKQVQSAFSKEFQWYQSQGVKIRYEDYSSEFYNILPASEKATLKEFKVTSNELRDIVIKHVKENPDLPWGVAYDKVGFWTVIWNKDAKGEHSLANVYWSDNPTPTTFDLANK